MANKTKPTPHKEEAREKGPETRDAPPPPLLDLSDDAVIKMIKGVKKRGYVTYEQLNLVTRVNYRSAPFARASRAPNPPPP
jgi:hypothetical protein